MVAFVPMRQKTTYSQTWIADVLAAALVLAVIAALLIEGIH